MARRRRVGIVALLLVVLLGCALEPVDDLRSAEGLAAPGIRTEEPAPSFSGTPSAPQVTAAADSSVPLPPPGHLYHAVFPGDANESAEENGVTLETLRSYERAVGAAAAWVYFSHNWYQGRSFPLATVTWIRDAGSVPYIRLMLRSSAEQGVEEPAFTLNRIMAGDWDADLRAWARAARDYGSPLIAEYGTEVNGEWFSWNGVWNGGGRPDGYGDAAVPDGPEKFRDAYRHIVQLAREEGATNITWVFHVNGQDIPDADWNRLEAYYPGDAWMDWIGVSVYGAGSPQDSDCEGLSDVLDAVYPRLAALSLSKPIVLLEFGVTSGNPLCNQAKWAEAALTDIIAFRWPRLIGFSWWNEGWQNDDDPSHDTNMRVQDNAELAAVFRRLISHNPIVLGSVTTLTTTSTYLPNVSGATDSTSAWWRPAVGTTWQWQLTDTPIDASFDVQVYDIDLFDNDASVVASLHAQGRQVIAYVSVGSWEEWRPDKDSFPASVIGKDYDGWPGEKWLDIRQIDLLAPVIRARLDQCKDKGFDGIEPDNVDGYTHDTGFPLTYEDQLRFNTWLAREAHARGLSIGLKNDSEQVAELLPHFDWAMTEDCLAEDWCEQLRPFIAAGKAVFSAEYTDTGIGQEEMCAQAQALGLSAILKHRNLDAWRQGCP